MVYKTIENYIFIEEYIFEKKRKSEKSDFFTFFTFAFTFENSFTRSNYYELNDLVFKI